MATVVHVPHPIAGCFHAAAAVVGPGRVWRPDPVSADARAARFAAALPGLIGDLAALGGAMTCTASADHAAVNAFFVAHGFPEITLSPFADNEFGVGAILNVAMAWREAGSREWIWTPDHSARHPAVLLESGGAKFRADGHPHPIARIATKQGFDLWLTLAPGQDADPASADAPGYADEFAVASAVDGLRAGLVADGVWQDALFPMVALAHAHDLGWAVGFNSVAATGQPVRVVEAKQVTKFGMDETGAALASAAAMTMAFECMRWYDVQITKPFLLWITRDGASAPVMAAYVDRDAWKDPQGRG